MILNYVRVPLAFQPSDALTVTDYSLKMVAQVTARERGTGKVLLNRNVIGSTLVIVGSDLTSAERQALPLLAMISPKMPLARWRILPGERQKGLAWASRSATESV